MPDRQNAQVVAGQLQLLWLDRIGVVPWPDNKRSFIRYGCDDENKEKNVLIAATTAIPIARVTTAASGLIKCLAEICMICCSDSSFFSVYSVCSVVQQLND